MSEIVSWLMANPDWAILIAVALLVVAFVLWPRKSKWSDEVDWTAPGNGYTHFGSRKYDGRDW